MFCTQCGKAITTTDRFCASCGTAVKTVPSQFGIDSHNFHLAGWLAVTNSIVQIPIFFVSVEQALPPLIDAALTLISLSLSIYVVLSFKRLLNSRFRFHDVDTLISVSIWASVIVSVLYILSLGDNQSEDGITTLLFIAIITAAIIYVVFGAKLLRLPYDLNGLLKPYAGVIIASGCAAGTIILFPLAVLLDVVAGVILGVIFFRAAEGR